jgi:hypothetical protein
MRSEYKVFGIVAAFLFLVMGVYWWWTDYEMETGPDYIGVVALGLGGLLCGMCALYFWIVSRRIDLRPEDRDDAEISDGAGEIGFFSPGSYWPVGLALATVVTGIGLVFLYWWLVAAGLVAVLLGTGGLLFEYYTGARKAH